VVRGISGTSGWKAREKWLEFKFKIDWFLARPFGWGRAAPPQKYLFPKDPDFGIYISLSGVPPWSVCNATN